MVKYANLVADHEEEELKQMEVIDAYKAGIIKLKEHIKSQKKNDRRI